MIRKDRLGAQWELAQALAAAVLVAALASQGIAQQLTAEERSTALLNSANAAYNDGNYPLAAERFQAYLKEFGGRRGGAWGRYGLALTLLEGPAQDFVAAADLLQPVVNQADFPERALALYYFGVAQRGLGDAATEAARANPAEAQKQLRIAQQRYDTSAQSFAGALQAWLSVAKPLPADVKELPSELEWAARARCDQADMCLRVGKAKEALALLEPWLAETGSALSRSRRRAIYLQGYASFSLKDYLAAGRALASLTPFDQPGFGVHARYLLARTHHLCGERPEAAALYEAVNSGYQAERKAAEEALKHPDAFKDRPQEKSRLEDLLRKPAPEYVVRAGFYWAVLLAEQGKHADALARLVAFQQQFAQSPLVAEAKLRQGVACVQLKQINEGVQALSGLIDHPQLGDEALLWLARAQVLGANPDDAPAFQRAAAEAAEKLRRAAERLRTRGKDEQAKSLRGEVLMELSAVQLTARQYKEAAATCAEILQGNPELAEQALVRQAAALQLGGLYKESEQACQRFLREYPKSALLGEIQFRYAESAYLTAAADAQQQEQARQLYQEALRRYQLVLQKHADAAQANYARQAAGMAHYRLGQVAEAIRELSAVPEAERGGDLATVSYLLADCKLRTLPAEAEDALATARLIEQINEAIYALNAVFAAQETGPYTPDALIKTGYCHQRIASLMSDPMERRREISRARLAYVNFLQRFKDHPLAAVALFEQSRCMAQLGDVNRAAEGLKRFQAAPLKDAPIAPLALIRLADYHRLARRPAEAVKLLEQLQSEQEASLLKDPQRLPWVPALRFSYGLALKDAGKLAEARAVFEAVVKQFPDRPEAIECVWRIGQTRKDEVLARVDTARKALLAAPANSDQAKAARSELDSALAALRDASAYLEKEAGPLAEKPGARDVYLWMLYDAAWCCRTLADAEVETARERLQQEAALKLLEKLKQENGGGPVPAGQRLPEIPASQIPLQPSEQKTRELYQRLIESAPDATLANDARFELGDLLARREEYEKAIPVLQEALEMEPLRYQGDRIRLRLGASLLARELYDDAAAQFTAIIEAQGRNPLAPYARYGLAECLLKKKDLPGAIQQLVAFRDDPLHRNVPGTTDRSLVLLGQAYAQLNQWDLSRQAYEALVSRFQNSPWIHEARFGMGQAMQNLKQLDNAVAAYTEVVNRAGTEVAARAQMQIGLCRLEQKRPEDAVKALLLVDYTYDYPEWTASALCAAAQILVDLKQADEAKKLLERVIAENPTGRWCDEAKKRLAEIK